MSDNTRRLVEPAPGFFAGWVGPAVLRTSTAGATIDVEVAVLGPDNEPDPTKRCGRWLLIPQSGEWGDDTGVPLEYAWMTRSGPSADERLLVDADRPEVQARFRASRG